MMTNELEHFMNWGADGVSEPRRWAFNENSRRRVEISEIKGKYSLGAQKRNTMSGI